MEVFDIHQHLGGLGGANRDPDLSAEMLASDYERRIRMMDENGIDKVAIMPAFSYLMPNGIEDTKRINNLVAEYRARHHDRFPVAMGTVEPRHGERSLEEIDRIVKELQLSGIVWHHRFQGVFMDDAVVKQCLQKISTLNIPVFIHVFAESTMEAPWRLDILLEEFPEITFVALDPFSSFDYSRQMMDIAGRRKNILFDTALMVPMGMIIEQFVARFGSERLLFGTDFYTWPIIYRHLACLYEINKSQISEEDKHNILSENARKLLML